MCPHVCTQWNGAYALGLFNLQQCVPFAPRGHGMHSPRGEAGGKGRKGIWPVSCCVCLLFKERADSATFVSPPLLKRMSLEDEPFNTRSSAHIQSGFSVNVAKGHCPASLNVDSPPSQPWVSLLHSSLPGLQPACPPNGPSDFSPPGSLRVPAQPCSLP